MFRRSFSTAVNMMAAETHLQCSTFVSGTHVAATSELTASSTCTSITTTTSDKNLAQRVMEHSTDMGFAARAVKMSISNPAATTTIYGNFDGTQRQAQSSSFIATQDGQRLGVSTGTQSVKSMRKYLRSNNQDDIHGGCDWTVLSCTPTSASFSGKQTVDPESLQFCIAATQKGSTCSTTVCRGSNGSIAYHSQPSIPCVETNYFYARPNDYVMLHSVRNSSSGSSSRGSDAAQAVFQRAIRRAARGGASSVTTTQCVDVETLAESVLDTLNQHGEEATVVIARLGYISDTFTQPPSTA